MAIGTWVLLVVVATGAGLPGAAPAHVPASVRAGNKSLHPYTQARAEHFYQFASAAYCSADSIAAWTCQECTTNFTAKVFVDKKTSTQAYVGRYVAGGTQTIIVAFRGSTDLANWITNLNFPLIREYPQCHGCKVHEGFYDAWLTVQKGVLAEVSRLYALQSPLTTEVYVTGHSLGAALAVLSAAEIGAQGNSTLGIPVTGVYTYGDPRVGNQDFQRYYNNGSKVSWRVTHWMDPVPHLPPKAFHFRHISTEVFYNENSSDYHICNGSGEDPACSDRYAMPIRIPDHLDYFNLGCCC